ncbi:class I adenylate cyclase [Allohahella marinimesophila]|uniref:Class I adenylate cyclase n=1 Tax=Allohahella marinimesophila TaxID=1054972 RepID=A0ABP7P892_9GAMM
MFLSVLPVLFHVNHPLLPGFTTRSAPCGIVNFSIDKPRLKQLQRLSRSFQHQPADKLTRPDVIGLYIMGSPGTLAQSSSSDIDVWLVYRNGLTVEAISALDAKAKAVSAAAAELGIDLHFFPMNAARFRKQAQQRQADSEDSGTAQHYVLLDEFYRTCVYLAGAWPLWWLIPPDCEKSYDATARLLAEKRFIRSGDYVDFGGCREVPENEFIGAGLWQLYKSIDSPYKSLLKLSLMECYARRSELLDAPEVSTMPLCVSFKAQIYRDEVAADQLDPYLMLYWYLERCLTHLNMSERLALVRQSFYLKAGTRLSRRAGSARADWKARLLQQTVDGFGWSADFLRYLDRHDQWKTNEVVVEQRRLVQALTASYRFLSSLARSRQATAAISARDVHLLGRKLYAQFQRKAGKLELINSGINSDLSEQQLTFELVINEGGAQWEVKNAEHQLLRESESLIELLAWCHLNGQLRPHTSVRMVVDDRRDAEQAAQFHAYHAISLAELQQLIQTLNSEIGFTASDMPAAPQASYLEPATLRKTIIFLNVGVDPLARLTEKGLSKVSNRTDPLSFSEERVGLVSSVDLLISNSWNEVSVLRFESGDTLMQCLRFLLASKNSTLPVVVCFCHSRALALSQRVGQLCRQLLSTSWDRYVIEQDKRRFLLERDTNSAGNNAEVKLLALDDAAALIQALGRPRARFMKLVIDDYALGKHTLKAVAPLNEAEAIQICFDYSQANRAGYWVFDAFGTLCSGETAWGSSWIGDSTGRRCSNGLLTFIRNALDKLQMQIGVVPQGAVSQINCFIVGDLPVRRGLTVSARDETQNAQQLARETTRRTSPVSLEHQTWEGELTEIRIVAHVLDPADRGLDSFTLNGCILGFDLYCEHMEFAHKTGLDGSIAELARYLSSGVRGEAAVGSTLRPFTITDLSLPVDASGDRIGRELADYLRCRDWVERGLWRNATASL